MLDPYIQQYGRRLYGLCRTLCANSFDADDLYQETWLKAFRHFSQYDPARPFEPWLTQICVNTYRSVLRRAFRSPILPFRTTQEQDEASSPSLLRRLRTIRTCTGRWTLCRKS